MTILPELGRQALPDIRPSPRGPLWSLHLEQMSCPSALQGLGHMGLSAKPLWPRVNYLLPEEGLRLALAVWLDAANVVGCGAVQDLQKLLQGGLQRGGQWGSGRAWSSPGASAGPRLETTSNTSSSPLSPETRDQDPHAPWDDYWMLSLAVPEAHSSPHLPLLLTSASGDLS